MVQCRPTGNTRHHPSHMKSEFYIVTIFSIQVNLNDHIYLVGVNKIINPITTLLLSVCQRNSWLHEAGKDKEESEEP